MVSKWTFRKKARQILFAFKNDEMHLHDALARLEQLYEDRDRGRRYGGDLTDSETGERFAAPRVLPRP